MYTYKYLRNQQTSFRWSRWTYDIHPLQLVLKNQNDDFTNIFANKSLISSNNRKEILSPFTISCQQGQSFPFYSIPNHPHAGLTPFLSDPPLNRGNVPLFIPNLWPNGQSWIESSSSCRWFWRGFWGGNFPGNRFDN